VPLHWHLTEACPAHRRALPTQLLVTHSLSSSKGAHPPFLQLEHMQVTREQAERVLPHYQAYRSRMEQLGEEAASSLATLQELQQASLWVEQV